MVSTRDEYFHERNDDPYWNESAFFSFMVPERQLCGQFYFWHRPNLGYTTGGVFIWDPTGDTTTDCLHYNFGEPYPLTAGSEMFDFSLPNGLTVACVDPLKTYRFSYRGPDWYRGLGCELELTWNAIRPPADFGLPAKTEEWAIGHYQQTGTMTGTLRIESDEYEISCYSMRDHSWGPRKITNNPRSDFPWAIASDTSAFLSYTVSDIPIADDPIIGTVERANGGWYVRDGELSYLVSGEYRALERGPDGRPLRVQLHATDALGRTLEAEGRALNMLKFTGYQHILFWWPLIEWQFDGVTAYGEAATPWPIQQARRFLRSAKTPINQTLSRI